MTKKKKLRRSPDEKTPREVLLAKFDAACEAAAVAREANKELRQGYRNNRVKRDRAQQLLIADLKRVYDHPDNPYSGWAASRKRYRDLGHYPEIMVVDLFGTHAEFERAAGLRQSRGTAKTLVATSKLATEKSIREYAEETVMGSVGRWAGAYSGKQDGVRTVVVGSDFHGQVVDPFALRVWLDVLRMVKPDGVVLNGDVVDFAKAGRYSQIPGAGALSLSDEIAYTRKAILGPTREAAGKAWMTYHIGNHEHRLVRFLADVAPQLADLRLYDKRGAEVPLRWDSLFGVDEYGIEMVFGGNWLAPRQVDRSENIKRTWKVYYDALVVTHGHSCAKNAMEAELLRFGLSGTSGHCFDEETEILTPRGWKKHHELREGDPVMTWNRDTEQLEFQRNTAVFRYDDKTELVRIKSRDVDLLLTPEHGLVSKTSGGWQFETAESQFGTWRTLPASGKGYDGGPGIAATDDQLRAVAWILAEGHVDRLDSGLPTIRIAQSDLPDGRMALLESALVGAGLSFTKAKRYDADSIEHGQHRNFDAYRLTLVNLREAWGSWLSEFILDDKAIAPALWCMSKRQMLVFLEAFLRADGNKNSSARNSYQISAIREHHVDFLQAVTAMCGHRTSKLVREQNGRPAYVLTYNTRNEVSVEPKHWSRVSGHTGTVWCVSVPNGTLLVRRGGKTVITQNTHRPGIFTRPTLANPHLSWTSTGMMAGFAVGKDYVDAPSAWTMGFGVFTIDAATGVVVSQPVTIYEDFATFAGRVWRPTEQEKKTRRTLWGEAGCITASRRES